MPARERVGLGDGLRRYWLVMLACVAIFVVLGGVLGLRTKEVYSASAQLIVSEPSGAGAAQLPGVVQASQEVAANSSRLIGATAITVPLARQFDSTPEAIANAVSATPVPLSSLIKITAQSDFSHRAVALANATATVFSKYVTAQSQNLSATNSVLRQYKHAAVAYQRALEAEKLLRDKQPTAPGAIARAAAATGAARLREQAFGTQYANLSQASNSSPTVTPFLPARGASSNRSSNLEIAIFAGLIVGLVIGGALTVLIANRRTARGLVV